VDLPEAIFFQHGRLYLAHRHIPDDDEQSLPLPVCRGPIRGW
jgi:hypothetical protein